MGETREISGRPCPDDWANVAISGRPCPVDAMSKESKATKLAHARDVILGLRKSHRPGDIITIDGVSRTRDEVIAIFQGHIDALKAKDTRYAEYLAAVDLERKLARQVLTLWLHMQKLFN